MRELSGTDPVTLSRLELYEVRGDIASLYTAGEALFLAARDDNRARYLFTNRRLIIVEDLDAGRHSFSFLPYSRLQYYALETRDINTHSEQPKVCLLFTNGFQLHLQFRDSIDLEHLQLALAEQL